MTKYSSAESEYLIHLLRCAIKREKPNKAPDNIDWKALIDLSKLQQVYSVIAPVIDFESIPREFAQELQLYSQNELLRMLAMKSELEKIEKDLEENEISFMLLKGSVIRNYYPLQRMRQMSDFDILYDKSKRDALISLMSKREYKLFSCGENSDDFSKKPFYTFEFHRELFFDEHDFCPDFSEVWSNAKQDENNPYKYHMSNEDLYLHTVAHMYKHYILGGFGIRFIADVYVLLESLKSSLDKNYIAQELSKMRLTAFEKNARELTYAIFNDTDFTDEQIKFLDNVMSFGIYGSGEGGARYYFDEYVAKHGKTSIAKYYLAKSFPDMKFMKLHYPALEKKPFLLPYFYIKRIISKFIYNRKVIFKNIRQLKESQRARNKD